MNMFALSFIAMLALVLAELAILKFARDQSIPWKRAFQNLARNPQLVFLILHPARNQWGVPSSRCSSSMDSTAPAVGSNRRPMIAPCLRLRLRK
jgi:hypothetical protein